MTNHRKATIAARFDAAHHYEQAASIQKRCATTLASWIKKEHRTEKPKHILEFGCGTGLLSRALIEAFPQGHYHLTDIAPAMVERTRHHCAALPVHIRCYVMDGEAPHPHQAPPEGFDLITSNLCLQWFEDRARAFQALTQLLRPGGRLMVSTLQAGSLHQWRESCHATATACGVPNYPTLTQLEQDWPAHGRGVWRGEAMHDPTPSARDFLQGLRRIGASLPRHTHRPAAQLRKAMRYFDAHYDHVTYHAAFGLFQKGV